MIILVLTPKCPGVISDHMLESLVQYISLLSTTSGQVVDEYTECTRDSMFDFLNDLSSVQYNRGLRGLVVVWLSRGVGIGG